MLSNPLQLGTQGMLAQVKDLTRPLANESDPQMRDRSLELRFRAQAGEKLQKLMPEAFALVIEAAERTLGMRHYDVQLIGGAHLASGKVIEMETGQGKTLTATLPLYLYALQGHGSHLATSNDYLARRDADTMRPLFCLLGMTTGVVCDGMNDEDRRDNYKCDITYGTAPEFGFDFLRDRMKRRAIEENTSEAVSFRPVQRDLFFLLADEADALLIDEANTPLVIGVQGLIAQNKKAMYDWAAAHASEVVENKHFKYRLRERKVELLREGRNWVRNRILETGLRCNSILDLYEKFEQAISVHRDFHRDQQYIIRDGKIVLVNDATGRPSEGREWQEGIQQAIQAAERIEITPPTTHAAKLTIQGLFLSYKHLSGMTGTAVSAASELRKVYKLPVATIPPNVSSKRKSLPTKYFSTEAEKWMAICDEISGLHRTGRPVLVGTRNVEKSEVLSNHLRSAGIPHEVLNAREHASEAKIIAEAGQRSAVTVATSMAGRGTDIKLSEEVIDLGGLHVIVSELHDSPRQDRQLFGRCARQGAPGSYRQYLSIEDEILTYAFGADEAKKLRTACRGNQSSLLANAQKQFEKRNRQNRLAVLHQEKRRLRSLWEMGRDPLLDVM